MEFDETDNRYLDRFASVVIGFVPDADLERTGSLAKELSEYVVDNPVFQGFDIGVAPRFFSGIEWYREDYDSDSESDDSGDASSRSWTSTETSEPPPSDAESDTPLSRVSSART